MLVGPFLQVGGVLAGADLGKSSWVGPEANYS